MTKVATSCVAGGVDAHILGVVVHAFVPFYVALLALERVGYTRR